MKKTQPLASIQKKIIVITLSCIAGMCIFISLTSYFVFARYLRQRMILSAKTNLQLLSDTINQSILDVQRMVQYCQTNSKIAAYTESGPNPNPVLSVEAHDALSEEYNLNASHRYIPRVVVVSHDRFLQIVAPSYSSTARLAQEIPQLPFFEELLTDEDYNFSTGLIADPFYRKGKQILPILRPIASQYSTKQAGYVFIEVSAELFTDPLSRYQTAKDSFIYLTIGPFHYLYQNGVLSETAGFSPKTTGSGQPEVQTVAIAGGPQTVVSLPLNMPSCTISQSISSAESADQFQLFFGILASILLGILAIGALLVLLMNQWIHRPVARLRDKISRISAGDFSRDPEIEWGHELGEIGRGINDLSENMVLLLNKRVEDEKKKRALEYQMLQSQINPHFLYNTLNSIKWMATIQGADGISEMTTALSRLLKSISKGTRLVISISEELALVENYFTIQKYRYGGSISLDIQVDDPELYDCQILKFTLQPLVENAIFHGIEPTGRAGRILIHVYRRSDSIVVDVTDSGVGISPEKAAQILQTQPDGSSDFFREIGISNVHSRLQYEFGSEYGIAIQSTEGEYTTMSVHLPDRKTVLPQETEEKK